MKTTTRAAYDRSQRSHPAIEDSLNAYEILNADKLAWDVRLYSVQPANGKNAVHEERGSAKNAFWTLRKQHAAQCSGYGFVIDVNPTLIRASIESMEFLRDSSMQFGNHLIVPLVKF